MIFAATARPIAHQSSGGFTMAEVLVTMLVLTITLVGLAALQLNSVRQGSDISRASEATRLGQAVLQRYQTVRYGVLGTTGGNWTNELQPGTEDSMSNVGVDGTSDGPYSVQRLIEANGTGFLITVRVTWSAASAAHDETGALAYAQHSVLLSTQRYR